MNIKLSSSIFIIIFLLISIFSFSNILETDITLASENNLEWSVTINFFETGGTNSFVVFGEAIDGSDGKDSYDVPIPPPGISPYIRTWFDSGLEEPYNSLIYDIKSNSDESKIWNLYVQWVPTDYSSSNDITLSWDLSEITTSGYETIVLFDYENDIVVADMKFDSEYSYESPAMVQNHFQIICNAAQSNNPPFKPSNPNPEDKATDVYADITLSWTGGDPDIGDEVKYDVYFGKNPTPQKVSANQSTNSYKPDALNFNTKYYWKIVSWDDQDLRKEGSVWNFTTGFKLSPPENIPPNAIIKSLQQGYVNQTIRFDASESNDSDGYIKYYRWDFSNDGKWDTDWIEEPTITYVYKISGNYSVKLQVKDNSGKTATANKKITIFPLEEGKIVPIAESNGPYSGIVNQSITFDASGSYDSDGAIQNFTWTFGDGTKGYEKITEHAYIKIGTYTVTLLVVDNDGLNNVASTTAFIFDNDTDEDGWGDNEENKYSSDSNDSDDFPLDTDNDHIPDEIDENDDNDGLSDIIEEKLGSDSKNDSDVLGIEIDNLIHFLIDTNKDGKSEIFYNSRTGNFTDLKNQGSGKYLLDFNGDGKWDYIYNSAFGTISTYRKDKSSNFQFELIIILICLCLIIFVIWFFKKRG
jgi:PKD repeat protein